MKCQTGRRRILPGKLMELLRIPRKFCYIQGDLFRPGLQCCRNNISAWMWLHPEKSRAALPTPSCRVMELLREPGSRGIEIAGKQL